MSPYQKMKSELRRSPRTWLVTGVAGFVGSNLLELLLHLGQTVVGLDNFVTGHRENLEDVMESFGGMGGRSFRFIEGDICDLGTCLEACKGVDYVLHQAALGSVPRSLIDPAATNRSNVDGFLNMLIAARETGVKRFVYAASSSTYGDHPGLPKVEDKIGRPLSPYAVTKLVNELYADVFKRAYGLRTIGLRYFNLFGRRQDPNGAYAAVIPTWIVNLLKGEPCSINGDGETSRDFSYIDNALQANLLAVLRTADADEHQVYNVASGGRTTLNQLYRMIRDSVADYLPVSAHLEPIHRPSRPGDVSHSQADISKIQRDFGYEPLHSLEDGLRETLRWYVEKLHGTAPVDARAEVSIKAV